MLSRLPASVTGVLLSVPAWSTPVGPRISSVLAPVPPSATTTSVPPDLYKLALSLRSVEATAPGRRSDWPSTATVADRDLGAAGGQRPGRPRAGASPGVEPGAGLPGERVQSASNAWTLVPITSSRSVRTCVVVRASSVLASVQRGYTRRLTCRTRPRCRRAARRVDRRASNGQPGPGLEPGHDASGIVPDMIRSAAGSVARRRCRHPRAPRRSRQLLFRPAPSDRSLDAMSMSPPAASGCARLARRPPGRVRSRPRHQRRRPRASTAR